MTRRRSRPLSPAASTLSLALVDAVVLHSAASAQSCVLAPSATTALGAACPVVVRRRRRCVKPTSAFCASPSGTAGHRHSELATTAFRRTTICGDEVELHESRLRNLGKGRGRIRRIVVRTEDGRQVSLLASSKVPAERLVEILWNRWRQENGFKHGNERWGINHLDGRRVEPYSPGTIIPNPARRKLERALKIWRTAEGDARRTLARLAAEDLRRERAERELAESLQWQRDLEAIRPLFPKHAPIEETELAGKLVRHTGKLKAIVDAIRIACANAEAELAAVVAPHMRRPREAKKLIANLLAAPGKVAVTEHAIIVRLAPAANRSELDAIQHLLSRLNQRGLILPSDHKRLPLRFESHLR